MALGQKARKFEKNYRNFFFFSFAFFSVYHCKTHFFWPNGYICLFYKQIVRPKRFGLLWTGQNEWPDYDNGVASSSKAY